jgi:hypothetical protein
VVLQVRREVEELFQVTSAPSVSYSITVRLEVPAGGKAVSGITHHVENAGGIVTALDVNTADTDTLRIDVTIAANKNTAPALNLTLKAGYSLTVRHYRSNA